MDTITLNIENLTEEERKVLLSLIKKSATVKTHEKMSGDVLIGKEFDIGTKVKVINIEPHKRGWTGVCLNEYIGATGILRKNTKFTKNGYCASIKFDDDYMNAIDERNGSLRFRADQIEILNDK